jgi:predicted glycosyltransferase
LRVPGFALLDYEFVDLRAFRVAHSYIVHPSVLGDALREQGFDQHRLIPYDGIKEDITFAGVDIDSVEPYPFAELDGSSKARLLVRPPDDRSHYHREASSELARAALEHLARRDDVVVILSPRYPEQVEFIQRFDWRTPPLVLREAVPFQRLLIAVDAVLTGGGTMAREAAYLGVPSFSVYSGRLGAVDSFLEKSGRLVVVRDVAMLDQLHIERRPRARLLASNPRAVHQIVEAVSSIAVRKRS